MTYTRPSNAARVAEQTEIRHKLLTNGFMPRPLIAKKTELLNWNRVTVDSDMIEKWGRREPDWLATGVRIEGPLVAVDLDIDDAGVLADLRGRLSKKLDKRVARWRAMAEKGKKSEKHFGAKMLLIAAGRHPAFLYARRQPWPDLTHDALAVDLGARHFDQDARYVALWGKWLLWDGVRWEADDRKAHMTATREYIRETVIIASGAGKLAPALCWAGSPLAANTRS